MNMYRSYMMDTAGGLGVGYKSPGFGREVGDEAEEDGFDMSQYR